MGKTILITGVSSGIGYDCAQVLSKDHNVVGCSRHSPPGEHSFDWQCVDITNDNQITSFVDYIQNSYLDLNVIVHNAGMEIFKPSYEKSFEEIETIYKTNLISVVKLNNLLFSLYKKNKPQIIYIGSIVAKHAYEDSVVYTSAKFGLRGYVLSFAKETKEFGIRNYLINPGVVRTKFFDSAPFGWDELEKHKPLDPHQITEIVEKIVNEEHKQLETDIWPQ
ncbi:SDR family oxidoreductase [Candidatus Margulisiibacteriota bacterium]